MIGSWKGSRGADSVEEHWIEPAAGQMLGMFRWIKADGSLFIYEILCLGKEGSSVLLKVKHFDKQLVGWEEKGSPVVFTLAKLGDRQAIFEQVDQGSSLTLVYERRGDDLVAYFDKGEEPEADKVFHYRPISIEARD